MFTVRRSRNHLRYASCLLLENSHPWMFPQRSAGSHELPPVTLLFSNARVIMGIPRAGFLLPNCRPRKLSFRNSGIVHTLLKNPGKGGSHAICDE
jgi:hypothetical protein